MAVAALTEFPFTIVAGNTLRVILSEPDYPSSGWTLSVVFNGDTVKQFTADSITGNQYELVIAASVTAQLAPGSYRVTFVYTDGDGEVASVDFGMVQVLNNPTALAAKSIARQTLEAMQAALLKIGADSEISVSFNGQSYTQKNLKDLQDAIDRQKVIVAREDLSIALESGNSSSGNIYTRFGSIAATC